MAEGEPPRVGEVDAAGAARPLEQLGPDDPLERRDLLAHRGLGVAEAGRGGADAALAGDRLERGQVAELDAEPVIDSHERYER